MKRIPLHDHHTPSLICIRIISQNLSYFKCLFAYLKGISLSHLIFSCQIFIDNHFAALYRKRIFITAPVNGIILHSQCINILIFFHLPVKSVRITGDLIQCFDLFDFLRRKIASILRGNSYLKISIFFQNSLFIFLFCICRKLKHTDTKKIRKKDA